MKTNYISKFSFVKKMIFIISLFLICNCNVFAIGYNYESFNWNDFAEKYGDYWTSSCEVEEDTGKCTETVLKSQKKFFTKLYKMLTKYERNGLYIKDEIIVSTLYFGLTPDAFKDDNLDYSNWFGDISFDFNLEQDDISVDDSDVTPDLVNEVNSMKMLIKAMISYEGTCSKFDSASYTENEDGTKSYFCNQGNLVKNADGSFSCKSLLKNYYVGLGERLLDSSNLLSFFGFKSENKKECENMGGTYTVASKRTVNENAYWQFLEESEYFDTKPHLSYRYALIVSESGYKNMRELNKALSNNDELYNKYHEKIVDVRKSIIEDIKYSLQEYYDANPDSNMFFDTIQNQYYFPIGSSETTSEGGKTYANGSPVTTYVIKDYNPGTNDGIDIGATGDNVNIVAVKSGVVEKTVTDCLSGDKTCAGGYGNYIILSHSDGTKTVYAFLKSVNVQMGQSVSQGEVIGIMGQTGAATEQSLHFEVKVATGARVNPNTYISVNNPRPAGGNITSVSGSGDKQTVCLSLKTSGVSDYGIAGIMANINFESGFKSNNLEDSYEKRLGYYDSSYTSAVDNSSYSNFGNDSAGYGLCQWTYSTRKQKLLSYAKQNGVSISDPGMQLSFLFKELQAGYTSIYNSVVSGNSSASEVASKFCHNFENPRDHSQCDTTRPNLAQNYMSYVNNGCN